MHSIPTLQLSLFLDQYMLTTRVSTGYQREHSMDSRAFQQSSFRRKFHQGNAKIAQPFFPTWPNVQNRGYPSWRLSPTSQRSDNFRTPRDPHQPQNLDQSSTLRPRPLGLRRSEEHTSRLLHTVRHWAPWMHRLQFGSS